jgi:hypothetical protein
MDVVEFRKERQMMKRTALAILVGVALGCNAGPQRPQSVAGDAEWVSRADGGSWINCGMSTKEPITTYRCTVWRRNGQPWLTDQSFALVRRTSSGWHPVTGPFQSIDLTSFDGDAIHLSGGGMLVPEDRVLRGAGDPWEWNLAEPH